MTTSDTTHDSRHHVVIIGSGFGGLFAAKALKRAPVRVTLVDRTNFHLFQPLLYQVATGILSEGQIAPPTRDVFRRYPAMRILLAEVTDIDPDNRAITVSEFGKPVTIPYDSLILAAGCGTSYFGHDEFQKHSLAMKSLDDALALRHQIYGAFEFAEAESDEERRLAQMTFVVVGGGPTGVEMAGQLRELSRRALYRNYRSIDPSMTRVLLVEGTDRLLGSMGDRVSRLTLRYMKRLGVEVHLNSMVTDIGEGWVELSLQDKTTHRINAATTIWAAGVKGSPLASDLAKATGADLDRMGRIKVESDCTVPGHPEIFVVGDLMALNNLPGLAEVAIQTGAHSAFVIRRRLRGKTDKHDFKYRDLGTLAAISRFTAVAKIGPLSFGGFLGWLIWLVVHITFLTGFKNRFGALMRWAVSFVGRGRSERALTGHAPIT
jgi:NADH:ubiquinone reductase (H+-translocating)